MGDESQGMAPRNNFAASPLIHSKSTFSPLPNGPVSLDVRSSQFSSGNNQHDPLASFLPPPPNFDASADASQQIGRLDNTGLFLHENDIQPRSPFVSTPRNNRSNTFQDSGANRERSLSSPGIYLRQPSFGALSPPPAPSSHILYEDKPTSWNEGIAFPSPTIYREGGSSSPSNYDRFNSRPPRHCGNKDNQVLLSPRNEMRHAASDGNFNFQSAMPPIASHMSPIANNGRSHPNIASAVIGSPSFDSSINPGHVNNRNSFGSMDALNSKPNFAQYQAPHQSPLPPGIPGPPHVHQDNYFVQQPPGTPGLQRHNSTGSQHFLVNERGEIVGHASPIITHNTLEGFAQGEPRNNLQPLRPQRANSYGGQHGSLLNPIQSHQGPFPSPFPSDPANSNGSSPLEINVGSIGDGRMLQHHRHNTEPIPPTVFNPNSGGSIHSRHSASSTSDAFDQGLQGLAGENIEGIEATVSEPTRSGSSGSAASEEKPPPPIQSYAAKLMMPRPQPTIDQTKGRVSSQLLTAGASLAKTGPRMIYNVKFKRSQRNFVLGQRVTREIKIGCYVKVEADRGEDLGIVMSIVPMEKFLASNRHRSMTEDSISSGDPPSPSQAANIGDLKRIMRVATHDEISLLEVKREEEEELLKICCTKVRQRGLPMSVVDAEYQFDRNKLTFFFQAEGRIDFRELVRDLFSMYKTRIWMQQLDKNGSPDEAEGDAAEQ